MGIIDAYSAILASGAPGTAFLEFGSITALENPGDGNGNIDAGDGVSLTIQLKNTGVQNATAISATLTSSTPGVTVTLPNTSAYPDLAAMGGSGTNLSPFLFTVGSSVQCPATINFTLTVNYTGGVSPQVLTFSVPSGPPPVNITSVLDTTAPDAWRRLHDHDRHDWRAPFPRRHSQCVRASEAFPWDNCTGHAAVRRLLIHDLLEQRAELCDSDVQWRKCD